MPRSRSRSLRFNLTRRKARRTIPLALWLGLVALTAVASAGSQPSVLLPTGRMAQPAGRITVLRSFPTGAAYSPDGRTILAVAGPTINGGPDQQLFSVDPSTGAVLQVLSVGDAYQSIVFSSDGSLAFVAGGTDGGIHVLDYAAETYRHDGDLLTDGFVSGLALSRDGKTVYAAEPNNDKVVAVDVATGNNTGSFSAPTPYELALSGDGSTLYATAWRGNQLTSIDLASGSAKQVTVGSHPTGVAVLSDGRVVTADSGDATLAVYDPVKGTVEFLSLAQVGRQSDSPNALAIGPGGRLYVSLGADDAVAVLSTNKGNRLDRSWHLLGLIPTGWYPDALALSPDGGTLDIVTARGLGHSFAGTSPVVAPDPASFSVDGAYGTSGTLEQLPVPQGSQLAGYTQQVQETLAPQLPANADPSNPILLGPNGPIKHVIYVTRENKTYDMVLGDLHPGPGNALVVFGRDVTPNLHELEEQFVESDNFTYQGFASVVGHMWEDAGAVSDVYEHAVASNTGEHFSHLSDSWHDPTNYPDSGLLVTQAWRAGLSVRTYDEETVWQSGLLPAQFQADRTVFPKYDQKISDVTREQGWESEFQQFELHQCTGSLAATYGSSCQLPALEYVYLGGDHTTVVDEPGYPTIQAQVADNDLATAKLIDAVSHSPDWSSTVVIVVEDDPQGSGDHVSAYRGLVAAASPWIKRGFISHTPYNLTSAVACIDRILGLPPITDWASTSRPLDDLFTSTPDYTPFAADPSGVQRYPFVPLPGQAPTADPAHGVYSFSEPDETNPVLATRSTWLQVKGTLPPWDRAGK